MSEVRKTGLLQDESLEAVLSKDGVVRIPFLNEEELAELRELYNQVHDGKDPPTMYDGIHMTIWHSDRSYKLGINTRLREILKGACDRTFKDYRAISQQFIVKRKGADTTFPIHQDWSIVDETKYPSFNLWIPIQDVDENNGAMRIVKGSHRLPRKIRGAGYLFPNYYDLADELSSHFTTYSMKAGEALLFFHCTLHGSPYNNAEGYRAVTQISVIPKDAPMQIYFQRKEGDPLEVHHPADDFTFYYDSIREESETRPPTGRPTEVLPSMKVEPVEIDEVLGAVNSN